MTYAALATLFVVTGIAGHVAQPWDGDHRALLAGWTALTVLLGAAGWIGRRSLLATALNRQLFFAVAIALSGRLLLHVLVALLGHEAWEAVVLGGLLYAIVAAMLAVQYQARLWPAAIAFGAAALGGGAWPDWRYALYAGASLVMLLCLAWVAQLEQRRATERPTA